MTVASGKEVDKGWGCRGWVRRHVDGADALGRIEAFVRSEADRDRAVGGTMVTRLAVFPSGQDQCDAEEVDGEWV